MPLPPLSDAVVAEIIRFYTARPVATGTTYATVRDYCDSLDHLSQITGIDGDLKNVQRPWAVKAVLGSFPPPARVLEIGGGEPIVSGFLARLGYNVTLVDPYDGFGNGPTDFEEYRATYPEVRIIRGYFGVRMPELQREQFDVIVSVSVIEHLQGAQIIKCFDAVREFLRPGGRSIHCFDFIVQGIGEEDDRANAQAILNAQEKVSGKKAESLTRLVARLKDDVETFYLAPLGHHHWRRGRPYDEFVYRKVASIQSIVEAAGL
jgi:SAM-dependent methyltransferase